MKFLRMLVPSALTAPIKLHPTSWVDGLKGVAMIVVYNYHFFFAWTPAPDFGWHHGQSWGHLLVHIFRVLFNGLPMVYIFFCLGGYVISMGPLRTMAMGRQSNGKLLVQLSSSLFRRSFRLLLPVFCLDIFLFLLLRTGIYMWARPLYAFLPGFRPEAHFEYIPPFWDHFTLWWREMGVLGNIFNWDLVYWGKTDPHQWFVPHHLRASIACYTALLLVANATARARTCILLFLTGYSLYWSRYEAALFMWGTYLANAHSEEYLSGTVLPQSELPLRVAGETEEDAATPLLPTGSEQTFEEEKIGYSPTLTEERSSLGSQKRSLFHRATTRLSLISQTLWNVIRYLAGPIWCLELLFALYLLSFPRAGWSGSLGFSTLSMFIPSWFRLKESWWTVLGSGLLVHCLSVAHQDSLASRLLRSNLSQLLGRLSFAFYLCHGPILCTIGFPFVSFLWTLMGSSAGWRWHLALIMGWSFGAFLSFLVAAFFVDLVEVPCSKLTKWIENRVFIQSRQEL